MHKPLGDPHPNISATSSLLAHSHLLGISHHVSPGSHSGLYQVPEKSSFVGNQSQLIYQGSTPFYFQERHGRINWRDIGRLDIPKLIEQGDLKQLELLLSNLTFAKLEEEDFERFGDATLLKLFKLSQLAIEYLMNTQSHLANQTQVLDNAYKASQEKLKPFEEQAKNNSIEIKKLREEIRYKKKLIGSYQNAIKAHKNTEAKKKHEEYAKRLAEEEELERKRRLQSPPRDEVDEKHSEKVLLEMMEKLRQEEESRIGNVSMILQQKLETILDENKRLQDKVISLEKKISTSQVDPNALLFQQIQKQQFEAFEQGEKKKISAEESRQVEEPQPQKTEEKPKHEEEKDAHEKRHQEQMEHLKEGLGHIVQEKVVSAEEEERRRIEQQRLKEQREGRDIRYVRLQESFLSEELVEDVEAIQEEARERERALLEAQERERARLLEAQEKERAQKALVEANQRMIDVIEPEPQQKPKVEVEDLESENLQESYVLRPKVNQTEYKDRNRETGTDVKEQYEEIPEDFGDISVSESFVNRYNEVSKAQKLILLQEKYMEKEKKLIGMAENKYLKKYPEAEQKRVLNQLEVKMETSFKKLFPGKDLNRLEACSEKELLDILGNLKKLTSAEKSRYNSIKTVAQRNSELINSKRTHTTGSKLTHSRDHVQHRMGESSQHRMGESHMVRSSNERERLVDHSQQQVADRSLQSSGSRQMPSPQKDAHLHHHNLAASHHRMGDSHHERFSHEVLSRRLPTNKHEEPDVKPELRESSNFYERDIAEGKKPGVRESLEAKEKKQAVSYFQSHQATDVRSSGRGPEMSSQRPTNPSQKKLETEEEEKHVTDEEVYYNKDPDAFKKISAQMIAHSRANQQASSNTNVVSGTGGVASSTKINQIADHLARDLLKNIQGPIDADTEKIIKQSVETDTKNALRNQKQSFDENLVRASVESIVKRSLEERREFTGPQPQLSNPNQGPTQPQSRNIEEPLRGSVDSNFTPTIPSDRRNVGGNQGTSASIDFLKSTEQAAFGNRLVDRSGNLREGDVNRSTNVVQRSVDQQIQKRSDLQ